VAASGRAARRLAAVVYNPLKVDLEKLRASIDSVAEAGGWRATIWYPTTKRDAGQGMTASALRRGATVVIAAGGDGTVRAVAEALRGSSVALAVVPSGTGNLLARNLDLPLSNLDKAIEIAFGGTDRAIDLGIAEITREDGERSEHGFLVMAGLGLDAKMVKNTSTRLKKAVGWLAYVDGIARSLPELKPVRLTYRLDVGPERTINVHTIIVGNCGVLPGGFLLMPDAKPDDGILDVAALRPSGPFGWAKVWRKVAWENGVLRKSAIGRRIIDLSRDVRDVTYFTTRELAMSVGAPQEFQLDGEAFGEAKSLRVWVDPGSLTVRVAPTSIGSAQASPAIKPRSQSRASTKASLS
jgi:diacylglycerol kinase family enzyme